MNICRVKVILCAILLFSGCASWSPVGQVTKKVSPIDGRTSVSLNPAIAGTGLGLGLYWDSTKGEKVFLVASIPGAELIDRTAPLTLIVDGEKFNFEPARKTDFGDIRPEARGTVNTTIKDYLITKEHVLKIANGKTGAYRIYLTDGKYLENNLYYENQSSPHMVPAAFRKFASDAWSN
jgi:hypothetical protein